MKKIPGITAQPRRLWIFWGIFQSPALRMAHALLIFFVLLQFLSSIFMVVGDTRASFTGWLHMWGGASAAALMLLLTGLSLKRHGLRYFYPYFWGDISQLWRDVRASLRFKLVPPSPGGLGAVLQGLGLVSLWLAAGSGLLWFALWQADITAAPALRAAHSWLAWLMVLYVIGHGDMELVHFIDWQRKLSRTAPGPDNAQGQANP